MTQGADFDERILTGTGGKRILLRGRLHRSERRDASQQYQEWTCTYAHSLLMRFPPVTVGRSARPLRMNVVFK